VKRTQLGVKISVARVQLNPSRMKLMVAGMKLRQKEQPSIKDAFIILLAYLMCGNRC